MTSLLPIDVPVELTAVGWKVPQGLSLDSWVEWGKWFSKIEGGVQWWLGDWWIAGHPYGERKKLFAEGGAFEDLDYGSLCNYGFVAKAFEISRRRENLSFGHHQEVAPLSADQQNHWLDKAEREGLSVGKLRSAIRQSAALERTMQVDLDAEKLGKFVILYADPPWRYENPPMGGGNRSIENQYPTMELEQIGALPINNIAHNDAVLFMWTTSPKLSESLWVLDSWGFECRTTMVWVKDKIGMGYHVREKHELLLIAKRGELAPPGPEDRPDSVVEAPRLEHSAKPNVFYSIIDRMYPGVRKVELFARENPQRPANWEVWGNQVGLAEAAE